MLSPGCAGSEAGRSPGAESAGRQRHLLQPQRALPAFLLWRRPCHPGQPATVCSLRWVFAVALSQLGVHLCLLKARKRKKESNQKPSVKSWSGSTLSSLSECSHKPGKLFFHLAWGHSSHVLVILQPGSRALRSQLHMAQARRGVMHMDPVSPVGLQVRVHGPLALAAVGPAAYMSHGSSTVHFNRGGRQLPMPV